MASLATAPAGNPMSWAAFLELPDEIRAEYVDGQAFVSPPPSYEHQRVCMRLRDQLVAQTNAPVAVAVGWRLPGREPRLRIPDLMVLAHEPESDVVTGAPPVVVEVLSTNRSDDLVRKSTEYLEAGAQQYWIVDPRDRVVDVFHQVAAGWERIAQLTDDGPTGVIDVPGAGSITVDLHAVLD